MTGPSAPDLAARLRGHVPRRFPPAARPWWSPSDEAGVPDRAALVERLAVRVAAGVPVAAAVAALRDDAAAAAAGLAVPADRIAAGRSVADAVRAWATACGCADLGSLAADLAVAVSADEVAAAFAAAAAGLRRRADEILARRAAWRARAVVTVAATATAASVALVLS